MSREKELYPLPQKIEKFLIENGYQEKERGRFELIKPGARFPDCSMTITGEENEILFTASHEPAIYREASGDGKVITWMPQKRAICYAINREYLAEPNWKWQLDDILRNMALSLFLPFFNLHKADQNGHLVIK